MITEKVFAPGMETITIDPPHVKDEQVEASTSNGK